MMIILALYQDPTVVVGVITATTIAAGAVVGFVKSRGTDETTKELAAVTGNNVTVGQIIAALQEDVRVRREEAKEKDAEIDQLRAMVRELRANGLGG